MVNSSAEAPGSTYIAIEGVAVAVVDVTGAAVRVRGPSDHFVFGPIIIAFIKIDIHVREKQVSAIYLDFLWWWSIPGEQRSTLALC